MMGEPPLPHEMSQYLACICLCPAMTSTFIEPPCVNGIECTSMLEVMAGELLAYRKQMRRHFRREIQFYPAFAMMVGNTWNPAKFCLFWATSCLHDVSNIPIPEFLRCALELVIGRIVGQPEFLCIFCRRKLYLPTLILCEK